LRLRFSIVSFAFCWLAVNAFGADVSGTVTNGTTGNPAAGVEVVLLSHAGNSMEEVGKTKADAQGRFSINLPDASAQYLVRVTHQAVTYSQNVPPGTAAADITIFDSARQVPGIFEDARVYRLQTANGQLEVNATYTLRNESTPPRTKMDTETYEVELPAGAQLVDASAAGPGGMALPTSPVPTGKKNRYALAFPIRPGQSQVNVSYHLPYSGSFEFNLTPDSQLSELGVLLPKSMHFNGLSRSFSQDVDEAGLAVFFTKNVPAHEQVRFSVSGEGAAPREAQGGDVPQIAPVAGGSPAGSNTHSNAIWYVLAGMIVVVAGGGLWLWRNSGTASASETANPTSTKFSTKPAGARRAAANAAKGRAATADTVLEALKDELFQLEKDRLDGKVSPEDHARLKAGLDALIRRQLKKSGQ
jgi:Carboxypeptidase regulatory-like domain